MKARISFGLLVSLFLLVGMLASAGAENPVVSASPVIAGNAGVSLSSNEPAEEWPFLLWMEPPCAESPEGCSEELFPAFYLQQVHMQLERVLPILADLREQGLIVDFMPIPAANAVGVTAGKDALAALEGLPGVARVSHGSTENIRAAHQSLADIVAQAGQGAGGPPVIQSAIVHPLTDPSVYVDDTFDEVWGYTTASASVSVTVRNSAGGIKATGTTTAGSSGYYWISFWSVGIVPGDMVYVTVAGRTVNVRVESLTARVEPATDYVRGTAPANRNIWISVSSNPGCDYTDFDQWTTSNSVGNYVANLAGSGNILRGDYVRVFVVDANNNGTMIVRYAPIARVYNLYDEVSGYTAPNATVTAVLKNSAGGIKQTQTTTANYYGYYYAYFSTQAVVGDRIEVTADGETMTVSVVTLTARVDAGANTVFGNGPGSGRQLKVLGCHLGVPYGRGGCYCKLTTVSGANTYSVNFSDVVDLVPDDWGYAYYTDASGNQIYTYANAPVTNAWKDFNWVWGYVDPKLSSVSVTLKNASNATRASTSFTPSASGYWGTYLWNGDTRVDIASGDRVEVVPAGGANMNVPVPGLTANLDISGDRIWGSAPANAPLHTYVWHWLGSSYSGYYYRNTASNSAGSYSASPGVDIVTCDYGETWYINPQGNRVYVRGYTDFADGYEPDDTYTNARTAQIDGTPSANHNFHVAGDYDWLKFHACAGVRYVIETFNLGNGGDTYLQLYDTNGTSVLREDDDSGGGYASRIEWTAPASGVYYVKIRHFSPSRVGCDTNYDFRITAAESGGVDLYTTAVIPVQVLEGQPLVLNKATALKVVVGKSGSRSLNDVQIKVLPAGGGELTTFYVDEPTNRSAADFHLKQPNSAYPLNFCPGDTSKTVYFFGSALTPTTTGSYHALVQVDYPNAVSETNENNNLSLPSQVLDVKDTKWSGWAFPDLLIQYFRTDWGDRALTDFNSYYESSSAFLKGVYPVAGTRFTPAKSTSFTGNTSLFRGFDGRLNDIELGLWILATLPQAKIAHPTADRFLAIVPQGWFAATTAGTLRDALGVAYPAMKELVIAEARSTSRPNGPSIAAHEIGHSYGLNLSCEDYDPCNPARQDGIGSPAGTGIWVDKRIPIEVTSARRVYSFMGAYIDREFWASGNAYSKLYNDHQAGAAVSDADSSSRAILAVGRFYRDGTVQLDNWYILPEAELSTLVPGPYRFEYQDAGGAVLFQQSFDISFLLEGMTLDQSPFVFTIPYVNGTARVLIKQEATTLAQKVASPNTPVVAVLSPNGGEQLWGGSITISWSASDADGDTLSYTVLYSANNGASWELIAGGLSDTSTVWSVQGLPASSAYRVKVVVTDGFNTGSDVSDAVFTVTGKTYIPVILR